MDQEKINAMVTLAEVANEQYWEKYHWAKPFAEAEQAASPEITDPQKDYKQFLPLDPTHPRAWIPPYVRWAKRKAVDFKCPITGWAETDWYRGITGGPYRKVGALTMDHILPGALGGLTSDENVRAISSLANTKKGSKLLSDDELRASIFSGYKVVFMPEDLVVVLEKYAVTQYKVGT